MPLPLEPSALQRKGWWLQQAHGVTSPLLLGCSDMWGAGAGSDTNGLWASGDVALAGRALSDCALPQQAARASFPSGTYPHSYGLTTVLQAWRGSRMPRYSTAAPGSDITAIL